MALRQAQGGGHSRSARRNGVARSYGLLGRQGDFERTEALLTGDSGSALAAHGRHECGQQDFVEVAACVDVDRAGTPTGMQLDRGPWCAGSWHPR